MIGKNDLEYFSRQAQGGYLNASEQQAVVREVAQAQAEGERYRLASLGMFDPVKVGQVVAQLQMERDEARAAARELLACWVPPQHENDYLKHWCWLKVAEPVAEKAREAGSREYDLTTPTGVPIG